MGGFVDVVGLFEEEEGFVGEVLFLRDVGRRDFVGVGFCDCDFVSEVGERVEDCLNNMKTGGVFSENRKCEIDFCWCWDFHNLHSFTSDTIAKHWTPKPSPKTEHSSPEVAVMPMRREWRPKIFDRDLRMFGTSGSIFGFAASTIIPRLFILNFCFLIFFKSGSKYFALFFMPFSQAESA